MPSGSVVVRVLGLGFKTDIRVVTSRNSEALTGCLQDFGFLLCPVPCSASGKSLLRCAIGLHL